jgi:hypothetical protein
MSPLVLSVLGAIVLLFVFLAPKDHLTHQENKIGSKEKRKALTTTMNTVIQLAPPGK